MFAARHLNRALAVALFALVLIGGRWDQRSRSEPQQKRHGNAHVSRPPVQRALSSPRDRPARSDLADGQRQKPEPDCEQQLRQAMAGPTLAGTPVQGAARALLLLYAKAEPVLFVRTPTAEAKRNRASGYRSMLRRSTSPWSLIKKLWSVFSADPELARAVLLREGYLYAEKPELAFALVDLVPAQLLFNDKHIWIQRGERLLSAERTRTGNYVFSDGAERGERARLLLFDRVGSGVTPAPLHRDLRVLRQRLGFDRVKVVHLSERAIVADLRYGQVWVRSLLQAQGAHLDLVCEAPSAEAVSAVSRFRAEQTRKERVLEPLRQAMLAEIEEGLPFDEPLTEYGQQDGQLRSQWLRAYETGKLAYEVNDDRYYVFGAGGQPLVPQVCIDFVFDTFERASGTWWRERGQPRERVVGKLDFGTLAKQGLRRTTSFIEFARSHPDLFDMDLIPERERIPFKYGQQLAEYLLAQADRFAPGDIVLIRGYAPWDKPWKPKVMHVHSFFVYESDPLTGMPFSLAGNPGRPVLQTWQFEAFRTPERSIWYRIRPRREWLEQVVKTAPEAPRNAEARAVPAAEPAG